MPKPAESSRESETGEIAKCSDKCRKFDIDLFEMGSDVLREFLSSRWNTSPETFFSSQEKADLVVQKAAHIVRGTLLNVSHDDADLREKFMNQFHTILTTSDDI